MDIEQLQAMCKKLPHATEDIKWGNDLCFCIAGKMFCVAGLGQQPVWASFKADDDEFDELCAREGFKPAPYMARHKWVWVDDIGRMNTAEWQRRAERSYRLVAAKLPAKTRKELGISL